MKIDHKYGQTNKSKCESYHKIKIILAVNQQ